MSGDCQVMDIVEKRSDLLQSSKALLELDAANALVPHGLGGHGRACLSWCVAELTRLRSLTAEMEKALERIERGEIDGGGCRRECADAGAIARSALSRSQEGK